MTKYLFLIIAGIMCLSGCVTIPEGESLDVAEEMIKTEEGEMESAAPEEPEPVYETVIIPLEIKATVYFSDGVIDRYTVTTYEGDSSRVERAETFNGYDELLEVVSFEYEENRVVKESTFGSDSKLKSYRVYRYDDRGLETGIEFYNARDSLQTVSTYEYDDKGNRTRWNVYGGSKNLLSYTEYLYDNRGRLSEMNIYSPDGTLEDVFVYEYAGEGIHPVKQTMYTPAGGVVTIVEAVIENGLIIEKRTITPSGSLQFLTTCEYGERGELLRESVFDTSETLLEYSRMEYILREEVRPAEEPDTRS